MFLPRITSCGVIRTATSSEPTFRVFRTLLNDEDESRHFLAYPPSFYSESSLGSLCLYKPLIVLLSLLVFSTVKPSLLAIKI